MTEKGSTELSVRYGTHLCGSVYNANDRCENLLYVSQPDTMCGSKKLKLYYVYCTADGKCRSLGCVASFTGNSPTWCPKRKNAANGTGTSVSGKEQ